MRKYSQDIFIKKSKVKHKNFYDYSLVNYVNMNAKVKIICPIHGVFEQKAYHHLKHGCRKCSINKNINKRKRSDINEFILKSKKVHGDVYDYSNSIYKGSLIKLEIKCNKCGYIFYQKPNDHLNGRGCPNCAINKRKMKKDAFIEKSNIIHNYKYDYSLVEYVNINTKVKIICNIHGVFEQTPKNHLLNKGCPKCGKIKIRLNSIKRIEYNKNNGHQLIPSFNVEACKIFDEIMKKENIFIQHALNGGEYYIKELGYWLDGYDKENNVVYEYDEKHHYKNGSLKEKDINRQKEIEKFLGCKFIRIKKE